MPTLPHPLPCNPYFFHIPTFTEGRGDDCSRAWDKSLCTCSEVHSPFPPLLPFWASFWRTKFQFRGWRERRAKIRKGPCWLIQRPRREREFCTCSGTLCNLQPLFSVEKRERAPFNAGRPRRGSRNERRGKKRGGGSSSLESHRNWRPERRDVATHLGRHFGFTSSRGMRTIRKRTELQESWPRIGGAEKWRRSDVTRCFPLPAP